MLDEGAPPRLRRAQRLLRLDSHGEVPDVEEEGRLAVERGEDEAGLHSDVAAVRPHDVERRLLDALTGMGPGHPLPRPDLVVGVDKVGHKKAPERVRVLPPQQLGQRLVHERDPLTDEHAHGHRQALDQLADRVIRRVRAEPAPAALIGHGPSVTDGRPTRSSDPQTVTSTPFQKAYRSLILAAASLGAG